MRRRGRGPRRWVARAALGFLLLSLPTAVAQAQTTCTPVPELGDVTVNQGVGSYPLLVRGKDTLVRLFLKLPAACPTAVSILPTGTKLQVKLAGTQTSLATDVPAVTADPRKPLGTLGLTTIMPDSPADPIFKILGENLDPAPLTSGFGIELEGTVAYQIGRADPRTVTFRTNPTTGLPIKATFNKFSNRLRVLAVPMGTSASQFTATTKTMLESSMQTVSRIYPAAKGVVPLGETGPGTIPGLKYSPLLGGSFVNVGANPWCGGTDNFDFVKNELANILQAWNANPNNASRPADIALGVIDAAVSYGGGDGCADGMAAVDKPVAWARLAPGSSTNPSSSGAVIAMEMAHTTALVPLSRGEGFHSTHTYADDTAPDRAYNVSQQKFIAEDRTVTNVVAPWNNNTTVLERDDWSYVLCKVTPQGETNSECSLPGGVGGLHYEGAMVVMTGLTNGTPAGTTVNESYVSTDGGLEEVDDPSSRYRLLQRNSDNQVIRSVGVDASFKSSHHEGSHDGILGETSHHEGLFVVATPFDNHTTRIELVDGATSPPTVLYATDRNFAPGGGDAPPGVIDIVPGPRSPRNLTSTNGVSEGGPALSDDSRLVAWEEDTDLATEVRPLMVGRVEDVTVKARVPGCTNGCFQPAWSSDGRSLAFLQLAEPPGQPASHRIATIPVDPSRAPNEPGFFLATGPTPIYQVDLTTGASLGNPTWSKGDANAVTTSIAFELLDAADSARLWAIDAQGAGPARPLMPSSGVYAGSPSWSHTPGDDRIAHIQWLADRPVLALLDPASGTVEYPDPDPTARAQSPSWGTDGRVVYGVSGTGGPDLWLLDTTTGGPPVPVPLERPVGALALAGDLLVFSSVETTSDLWLLDLDASAVKVEASAPPGSNQADPADLRMDLYVTCGPGSPHYPLATAAAPTSTTGSSATFDVEHEATLACRPDSSSSSAPALLSSSSSTGPVVYAMVNDGFLRSAPSQPAPVAAAPPVPPVAAISSPSVGQPYLDGTSIRLVGSGRDEEDGALTGTALQWFLDDNPIRVATGNEADLPAPAPGWHTVVLRATDSDDNVAVAEQRFFVEADADHDGIPRAAETCSSDADPLDAFVDTDGDGLVNLDDYVLTGEPCIPTTNYRVTADFDPDVLNPSAGGRTVSVTLGPAPRNWTELDPSTLRLHVPGAPGCQSLALPVEANGWRIAGNEATAKFDRQQLADHLTRSCNLRNQTVPFTVRGESGPQFGPWQFEAHGSFRLS